MGCGSPTAYLLWAVLSSLFFGFLIFHLWNYDKFQCLRWNAGRQPGAFKRVMTYTYVATMPLLVVFSVAMSILKYREGFLAIPSGHNIPTLFWEDAHRNWLLPLYFILSGAWALELITHLEELTFWLFMLHQGPSRRDWFSSWEVRVWYIGCIISMLGMPLTVLITRNNIAQCEAWVFLVGSLASTTTTLCFLHVLASFPTFIRHVKEEGAGVDVVVRLTTFYNLNVIRVIFRFFFSVPLLVLAVDGVQGQHRINEDPFWSDFLFILGAIGCFISSAITLLIFFPRSSIQEAGYSVKAPEMSAKSAVEATHIPSTSIPPSPFRLQNHRRRSSTPISTLRPPPAAEDQVNDMVHDIPYSTSPYTYFQRSNVATPIPRSLLLDSCSQSDLHPYVMTFTSPIDLLDVSEDSHGHRSI